MNATLRTIAAGAVLALAGSAMAQSGGDFDKPLQPDRPGRNTLRSTQPQARSSTVIRENDGEREFELRIEGGEVSAKVDGKNVPRDRVRRAGDRVEILDKSGKVIKTFHVGGGRGAHGGLWVAPEPPLPPGAPEALQFRAELEPPKVMLGINMMDQEDGVRVAGVIEDLPADQAGLQEDDLITEVDGEGEVTSQKIRDALKEKDPGDTVTFTVERDGESKRIKVTLAEYDAEKLGHGGAQFYQIPPGQGFDPEQMNRMLEEQMKRFRGQGQPPMVWGPGEEGEGGMRLLVPRAADPQLAARMKELEARMKELDKKLQKLDEQLSRLQEQLDR